MLKLAFVALLLVVPAAQAAQLGIPVPAAVIYSGDRISAEALVDKSFHVPDAAAKSFVIERRQIEGLYAKRMLLPGRPVPLTALKGRDAVTQGVLTRASFAAGGVIISTLLIPQRSASEGEIIDARNPSFGTLVKARVMGDGSLEVGP